MNKKKDIIEYADVLKKVSVPTCGGGKANASPKRVFFAFRSIAEQSKYLAEQGLISLRSLMSSIQRIQINNKIKQENNE